MTARLAPRPTAAAATGRTPRWTRAVPLFALLWSLGTAVQALAWWSGLLPHPFGDRAAVSVGALLNALDPEVAIALTGALGLVGAAGAVVLLHRDAGRAPGRGVTAAAWLLAAVAALLLVDGRLLPLLGYTPVVLTLGWTEPAVQAAYLRALAEPSTFFLLWSLLGGVVWGAAALAAGRLRRAACRACGRAGGWTAVDEAAVRARALRVGRVALAVAVPSALVYPAVRLPWLLGVPVGMDAASWAALQDADAVATGIGLGTAGLVGVVLMLGLVQPWGERIPRWVPWLGGRRVPVAAAVAPATVVAIALVSLGRSVIPVVVTGGLPGGDLAWVQELALLAMLPWGLGLAVATAAYAVRRRPLCTVCGQGLAPSAQPSSTADSSAREAMPSLR